MLDFTVYQSVKQRLEENATQALPASPVRPDNHASTLRHKVSVALHRIAERLDPHDPHPVVQETPACAMSD